MLEEQDALEKQLRIVTAQRDAMIKIMRMFGALLREDEGRAEVLAKIDEIEAMT